MPNLLERLPRNVTGSYYVDSTCIDCDLCRSIAPDFFRRDEETGLSFVYRQPKTSPEITLAKEALESCPSQSIGRDGVTPSALPHTTAAAAITAAASANISSVTAVERT
eukprot:gene42375-57359_t